MVYSLALLLYGSIPMTQAFKQFELIEFENPDGDGWHKG